MSLFKKKFNTGDICYCYHYNNYHDITQRILFIMTKYDKNMHNIFILRSQKIEYEETNSYGENGMITAFMPIELVKTQDDYHKSVRFLFGER